MSYGTIITELRQRLGGRSNIESRMPIWVNDAYYDLLLTPYFDFHELQKTVTFSTTANVREYELSGIAGDMWYILSVRNDGNGMNLRKKGWKDLDGRMWSGGIPVQWAHYGTAITLDPTPDLATTIRIRYMRRAGELVDGAELGIGREWDELVVVLATAKGYRGLEQPEKAANAQQEFDSLVMRRQSQMQLEDSDSDLTIGVVLEGYR